MAQERFIVLRLLKQERIKQKICQEDGREVACLRPTALNFVNLHQDSNTFAILSGSNFPLQYLVVILAVDSNTFAILSRSNFFYPLLFFVLCFFFSSGPHSNQHRWTGHPLINIVQNKNKNKTRSANLVKFISINFQHSENYKRGSFQLK